MVGGRTYGVSFGHSEGPPRPLEYGFLPTTTIYRSLTIEATLTDCLKYLPIHNSHRGEKMCSQVRSGDPLGELFIG